MELNIIPRNILKVHITIDPIQNIMTLMENLFIQLQEITLDQK
jgi:hypothetical protein